MLEAPAAPEKASRRSAPARRDGRKQLLFLLLAAFFLTNAVLAELIGGKIFRTSLFGMTFTLSVGVLLWPVVFISTDVVNEYFGRRGVKRLSLIAAGMIAYAFVALWIVGIPDAIEGSPIDDAAFATVFFQSRWIIVGSILAFLTAQLLDVSVFWLLRRRTGRSMLWARATGSTIVSQLVDTVVVGYIGLHLPHRLDPRNGVPFDQLVDIVASGYLFKLIVAIGVTPVLYFVHAIIDRALGSGADELIEEAAALEED